MPRFLLPLFALIAVLAFASPASAAPCAGADTMPSRANTAQIRTATLCLMNQQRAKHGRSKLRSNSSLQNVATKYARQMVRDEFFDHVSPGGSTLVSRVRVTNYLRGVASWSLGENLAWGAGHLATPAETVAAWMKSPGHRRNMLDRRFAEVGVGVALGAPVDGLGSGDAATYATEFGRRLR